MALRQYIGARYVPKFYENSDGNAEWRSGVAYEALTVVTYNGNSYTSKNYVPSTVGNPSANPEYWVSTGVYNEQIENLSTEVSALNDRVENVESEVENFCLYIGNSFAIGTDVNTGNGLYNRTKSLWNDSYLEYGGGVGFVDYDNNHLTFRQLAQRAVVNNYVDVEKVTHVFVISAMGDSRAYAASMGSAVRTALAEFNSYCRETFPNLKEILLALAETRSVPDVGGTNYQKFLYETHKEFKIYAPMNGIHYIGWTGFPCMYNEEYVLSDHYHPSSAGYEIQSQVIRDCYKGYMQYKPFKWHGTGEFSIPEGLRCEMLGYVHPDESYIYLSFGSTSNIPDTYATCASGDAVEVSLPSAVTAIPNIPSENLWISPNCHWGKNGKWLPYSLTLNNTGGTYKLRGIVRFVLTGVKSELTATAQFPINATLHNF